MKLDDVNTENIFLTLMSLIYIACMLLSCILAAIPETVSSMVRMDGNIVWPRYVTEQYLKDIYALELRNTDVLVITWPKSGKSDLIY